MLQEIRYMALTLERRALLRWGHVMFFERQAGIGARLTVGGTPGIREELYGWLSGAKWFLRHLR